MTLHDKGREGLNIGEKGIISYVKAPLLLLKIK